MFTNRSTLKLAKLLAKLQKFSSIEKNLPYMNVIIDTLCGFSNNSVFVSDKERRKLYVGKLVNLQAINDLL